MSELADLLLEPFRWGFMRAGLAAVVLVGTTCACLGVYVVLRRMAFIGDALAHTTLPGLVVAYLAGWRLDLGALAAGVATALAIGWLANRRAIREDTAIGIVFTAAFALGILIMSRAQAYRDLSHMLFGDILAVTPGDLRLMAVVAFVVLGVLALFHKEIELTSLDATYAASIGLSPARIRYVLLLLLALTVVVGIHAVGVVLTSAMLVTPAAAAAMLSDRIPLMMAFAVLVATASGAVGLYASFYADVASGPAIVLAATAAVAVVAAVRR